MERKKTMATSRLIMIHPYESLYVHVCSIPCTSLACPLSTTFACSDRFSSFALFQTCLSGNSLYHSRTQWNHRSYYRKRPCTLVVHASMRMTSSRVCVTMFGTRPTSSSMPSSDRRTVTCTPNVSMVRGQSKPTKPPLLLLLLLALHFI